MTGEAIAYAAMLTLMLALPVAALRRRDKPFDRMWKMAAIWVALFGLVALLFGWVGF